MSDAAPLDMAFGVIGNPKSYDWYRRWVAEAEGAGFGLITSGDSQSLWADPFVSLAVAAQATQRARLGVTVSNPRTRHPAVAASSLAALGALAPGRLVYGLSSGDSALRNLGLASAKVDEVGRYAQAVRGLCAGEPVVWEGQTVCLEWAQSPVAVWIAAEGPRMQRLAGEVADGVLLSNALDPGVLAAAMANIEAGAAAAGRDPAAIEVWCLAAMCFADSAAEGVHRLRSLLAGTANHVYRFHTDGKSVPDGILPALQVLRERYDYRHHASPTTAEANAQLVEDLGLVPFLAARSVIAGTAEDCLDRMREIRDIGVDRLLIHHHANDPHEFMETFRAGVAPHLAAATSA